jgi:hypothetical protein
MDTEHTDRGATRRELLKKGAIAGGTLLWATPLIQTLDLRAAAAQAGTEQPNTTTTEGDPPPVDTTTTMPGDRPPFPPDGGQAISHLDFLLVYKGVLYGVQYEPFGDGGAFVKHPSTFHGKSEHCLQQTGWTAGTDELVQALNVRATVQTAGTGEQRQYVVFLPTDITLFAAFSKCGQRCAPPQPWRGGHLFSPCPAGTEIAGLTPAPTTTTTPPTTTTSTTTTPPPA